MMVLSARGWRALLVLGLLAACEDPGPAEPALDMTSAGDLAQGEEPSFTKGDPARLLLQGRVVTPEQVFAPGEVLVAGERIVCAAARCADRPEAQGATVLRTAGVIFPGLVDGHNHTQYNYLPPWSPSPPVQFQRRDQWAARADYKAHTQSVNANETEFGCQQVKYGELRALLGGTTTLQGTGSTNRRCYRTLVHNAEYGNELGADKMRTNIPGVDSVNAADAATIAAGMADGSISAYVIHLAEGIDEPSRKEFDTLVQKKLLAAATVVIHGTALGAAELQQMGKAGAKLVWSPLSNLQLYGKTTDIKGALEAGIRVALAPDWTLSGSADLLGELKVAASYSRDSLAGLLTARQLTEMVTSTAADVLALGDVVGRLKPGLLADLLVLRDQGQDAYETLVAARSQDVQLVVVAGRLRYGDPRLMDAVAQPRCEALVQCGAQKRICVPDNDTGADTLNEDLMTIRAAVAGFLAKPPATPPAPYPLEVCM